MIYTYPSRETAIQAMELTKTDKAYLIIHDYWRDAQKRSDQAKQSANNYYRIDDQITILEYLK